MDVKVCAFSNKHNISICTDGSFQSQIDNTEEEKYCFYCGFELKTNGDEFDTVEDTIATVSGVIFDENKILDDGWRMDEIADMTDQDTYTAITKLLRSKRFKEEVDPNKEWLPLFDCYIDRVYVYPKYRKQGYGRYVFNNLCDIFGHCFRACPKSYKYSD